MQNDHLIITPSDRYYGEGHRLLLVDWEWEQIEVCLSSLRGCQTKLIISLFGSNDTDLRWLLDTAYQSDHIIINFGKTSNCDPIKGYLISLDRTHYFGRQDLSEVFTGYTSDPMGNALIWAGSKLKVAPEN